MLYGNGNSSIKLSNGTSPRFFLNRGVRQGCPVSPYLFLIVTQFLSMRINSSHLKGITIGNNTILISQLADDTGLFLYDSSQIPVALSILRPFSEGAFTPDENDANKSRYSREVGRLNILSLLTTKFTTTTDANSCHGRGFCSSSSLVAKCIPVFVKV